ncbi:hypothetical protein SLA2020_268550 [Shorea laevis]
MLRKGHMPSVVTYTCLIYGFCNLQRMDMANLLVDEMKRNKVTPDVVTYTVLIACYHRVGNIERANELFDEMKASGVVPDGIALHWGIKTGAVSKS